MNQPMAAGGPVGTTRNPVMVLIISMICGIYGLIQIFSMIGELKAYLQKDEIQAWHVLIPYYNIYWLWVKVPKWVGEAKQKAGCADPNPSGIVLYIFVGLYALANDLNQVWNPRGLPSG